MVGLGALPATIQFLILEFMPETPRWLVKANHKDRAKNVLLRVYGGDEEIKNMVNAVLRRIENEILEEEEAAGDRANSEVPKHGFGGRLVKINDGLLQLIAVGGNRRALTIACMLQGFQQLCGFVSPTSALCLKLTRAPSVLKIFFCPNRSDPRSLQQKSSKPLRPPG